MQHGMMDSALLPGWLRVFWAVLLFGVVVAHTAHASLMRGQRRWWHGVHTAMAAAMLLMYLLPQMSYPGPYHAGLALFAVLTVSLIVSTALLHRREGTVSPLWIATAADMLAMTYMLLPTAARPEAVSYLLAGYLACSAIAWALGLWHRLPALAEPEPALGNGQRLPARDARPAGAVGLTLDSSIDVRATLAVLAASMGYMLVGM